MIRHLTVRGVQQILSRAGVDRSGLEIRQTERVLLWAGGAIRREVEIRAASDLGERRRGRDTLLDAGLTVIFGQEVDVWSRQ